MSEQTSNVHTLPALPLKNTVLFPGLLMPLSVGRTTSLKAVQTALATEEKEIILVAQKDSSVETPTHNDLYTVGTKAVIRKMNRPSDELMELLVQGVERVVVLRVDLEHEHLQVRYMPAPLPTDTGPEVQALQGALIELAGKAIELAQPQAPPELVRMLAATDDPLRLVFLLASVLSLDLEKEQALLEAQTRVEAMSLMHGYLSHEVQVLELRSKIQNAARTEMSKEQREYMLRQQMKAIQSELGEKNPEQAEVDELRERYEKEKQNLSEEARKELERELSRLERVPAQSPEHSVLRTWAELVLELPWNTYTTDNLDIANARRILDEDHFNLRDVKDRILEHLSVLKMNPGAKAPILCLVGPPGVGKTSLGQSVARALGRNFERMSLGGLHDEAELRGHRRTYIGAMPGRLIQAVRRSKAKNPVLMLDEIDKLGRDYRGDPASALLEVLDPEQNKSFRDNYLDLNWDLSKVLFITTANTLDTIPRPLLDRMEVLRLSGYSEEEKIEIAKRYLIPRQLKETGLAAPPGDAAPDPGREGYEAAGPALAPPPAQPRVVIPDETLSALIRGWTREAGLRRLERAIGRLMRKVTLRLVESNSDEAVTVRPEDLPEMLGPEPFTQEMARKEVPPGVVTGLAWTETGGDVLYIEGTLLPQGKGLTLTGQLGEVMKESAQAARSWVWSHAERLGVDLERFKETGLHIHVPAGAIPKDGPSAGITMATAVASLYTACPARSDTAMTGEITLTGLVLPIGGVKEKLLAARRAGIRRVILPTANKKDLRDLPEPVRNEMEVIFADRIEQVLAVAIPDLHDRLALVEPKVA
ncbi:MAG TPA: endopeptidase La [Bryobacteraceae bacterium]|nr:endopeptidase La [Bryobacteraceae bacterium]